MESTEQTRRQWWIVAVLTLLVAATRYLALAHSLWDWDEVLFSFSLHDYNVAAHHPHPPGFPLFVALARLVRLIVHDDFRALRDVTLISSFFVFPGAYALGRALRFPFVLSICGALIYVFLPNVWAYSGTGFSDMLSIALLLWSMALLFTGGEDRWRYFVGTAIFSLSLLVRSQGVLVAFPWLVASWPRIRAKKFSEIATAMLLSIAIVFGGYGIAAYVTGPSAFVDAVRKHGDYVAKVDGYKNPNRAPILKLFPDFIVDPFEGGKGPRLLFGLAVAALFRPKRRDLYLLASFVPTAVMSLFMLNPTGASRLSMPFLIMTTFLAVDGIALIGETLAMAIHKPQVAIALELIAVAVLLGRFITWTLPALRVVHRTNSPPVEAIKWIREHVPPGTPIFVDGGFAPHGEYALAGAYPLQFVYEDEPALTPLTARNGWYIGQGTSDVAGAQNFTRPKWKLWGLFYRRYFSATVHPVFGVAHYGDGWYTVETDPQDHTWRWMSAHGHVDLQPIPSGGDLRVEMSFPLDREPPPRVQIAVDGKPIDAFVATATTTKQYHLSGSTKPHIVTFDVSNTVNLKKQHAGDDDRDLGLEMNSLVWRP